MNVNFERMLAGRPAAAAAPLPAPSCAAPALPSAGMPVLLPTGASPAAPSPFAAPSPIEPLGTVRTPVAFPGAAASPASLRSLAFMFRSFSSARLRITPIGTSHTEHSAAAPPTASKQVAHSRCPSAH